MNYETPPHIFTTSEHAENNSSITTPSNKQTPGANADFNGVFGINDFASLGKVFAYHPTQLTPRDTSEYSSSLVSAGAGQTKGIGEEKRWIGGGNSMLAAQNQHLQLQPSIILPPFSPLSPACSMQKSYDEERKNRLMVRTGQYIKMCTNCGTTSTPSWRRCSEGKNLLCNACGLYQKLHNKSRPFVIATDGTVKVQRQGSSNSTQCANCHTSETPLWRRGLEGECLCNACGLYLKQHQRYRQVVRKSDTEHLMDLARVDPLPAYISYTEPMQNRFTRDFEPMPEMGWTFTATENNNQMLTDRQLHLDQFANPITPTNSLLHGGCSSHLYGNDFYIMNAMNQSAPMPGFSSTEDRELYEKLLYLEDAAAILLSSADAAVTGQES